MLALIRCKNQRRGVAGIFSGQKCFLDSVNEGELRFVLLTVTGGRRIDWEQVAHILGENGKNVLLERGLSLPEGTGLELADTRPYRMRMLHNAAEKLLRQSASLGRRINVLLADETLRFRSEAELVLRFGGSLTVVSDRAGGDLSLSGQPVKVLPLGELNGLGEYTMILAPVLTCRFAEKADQTARVPVLVGEAEEKASIQGVMMTDFSAPLPERYAAFVPDGFEQRAFAAAVYACCNVSELGQAVPDCCAVYAGGRLVSACTDFS